MLLCNKMQHKLFSHACAIQEDDRVVITGGHSARTVSVYDENGWIEDLPNLNEERLGHACTSFLSDGKKVYIKNNTNISDFFFKIMMVSGGKGLGGVSTYSDTSEIWTGTKWRLALGKLPYKARDVRMAYIDNRILFLGNKMKY